MLNSEGYENITHGKLINDSDTPVLLKYFPKATVQVSASIGFDVIPHLIGSNTQDFIEEVKHMIKFECAWLQIHWL